MVFNWSRTKNHKVYNHKLRRATTLKSEQDTVNPKLPEECTNEELKVPVESKVPVKLRIKVPVQNFFKPIIAQMKNLINFFLPVQKNFNKHQQIEPVILAHMEDNYKEVDLTTTSEQGRSLKLRNEKPRVKFQAPKQAKPKVKQKRKNNIGNIFQGGKELRLREQQ